MRLQQWLILVGLVVGLGCLQVAQRNAIFFKGYAVGERMHRMHARETEVAWLNAEVQALQSPTRLAHVAEERRLKLVAWSSLVTRVSAPSVVSITNASPLVHVAAADARDASGSDDTSD